MANEFRKPVTEYDDMKDFLQRNFVMVSFDSIDMECSTTVIMPLHDPG